MNEKSQKILDYVQKICKKHNFMPNEIEAFRIGIMTGEAIVNAVLTDTVDILVGKNEV